MSTDHRKPVVAFVMLALAATLVIGVQHAEAQGGRLLAAAAGAGAHVQGTIAPPTQTPGSPADDRLVDLGPPFFSVRDIVGHADSRTVVVLDSDQGRGVESAVSRGSAVRPAAEAASSAVAAAGSSGEARKADKARQAGKEKATGRTAKPRAVANGPDSQRTAGPAGKASRSSAGKWSRGKSSPGKSSWGKGRKATRPGKTRKHATTHRSARASTRPARFATTSRATGVHPSGRHHRGAHGRH